MFPPRARARALLATQGRARDGRPGEAINQRQANPVTGTKNPQITPDTQLSLTWNLRNLCNLRINVIA